MELTRRRFLRLSGMSALGAVIFSGCGIPNKVAELQIQSPVEIPEDVVAGGESWYATLCRQCPSVEGVLVRVMEGRAKKVEGNPDYPLNVGKHSARCEAALQALYHPDRLTQPQKLVGPRGSGEYEPISWDEAMDTLVSRMKSLTDPKDLLMITDPLRGHLGMVVNQFATTYGGQHLPFEPMERVVLRRALKEVFDQDRIPHFDIKNTNYLLSFGADFLGTWVSPVSHAVAYGEFRQGSGRPRGTFVHVEPRLSMTAANADQWVPINPGTEGLLALSIAQVMISEGLADADAAKAFTGATNPTDASSLAAYTPEQVAQDTGLASFFGEGKAVERIRELAHDFATKRPSLAIGGDSTAAHTNGLFNLSAIYALNYLVGSVGTKGGVLFNPPSPLQDIPDTASGAPFNEWQETAARLRAGKVPLVITRGVNPVHGLPGALDFKEALGKADFVVSFASFLDETSAMANLILPEHAPLEAWGDDVPDPGPGYQTVGFQQPVVRPMHDTRAFGDVLLAIAPEVDLADALPWNTMQDLLKEGAQRLFALNRGSVKAPTFEAFWNGVLQRGGWWDVQATSTEGAPGVPQAPKPVRPRFDGGDFYLMPYRSLALLEGQNAHLPWLQATPDPITTGVWKTWVEINLRKAKELGISEGDVLELVSLNGSIEAVAYPTPAAAPDVLSIPMGQGHTFLGRYAEERGANPFDLLAPVVTEETGALAWAATKVSIKKTGKRTRMVKFEGLVPAIQLEGSPVVLITRE